MNTSRKPVTLTKTSCDTAGGIPVDINASARRWAPGPPLPVVTRLLWSPTGGTPAIERPYGGASCRVGYPLPVCDQTYGDCR